MRFAQIEWLHLLWLAPIVLIVLGLSLAGGRQRLQRFAAASLIARLGLTRSIARLWIKGSLIALGIASLTLAIARPQWNPEPREIQRTGRDVCFVIDCSRSMLAEDLAPSRLERAKIWVDDVVRILRGDRVALVAFAGDSIVRCPLTHDYTFFRHSLSDLSTESIPLGGSLIGDAIRTAIKDVFELDDEDEPAEARYRDIILITDGEDQSSFPVRAAEQAGELGIRIIAIGLGDEDVGTPIPIRDDRGRRTFVDYQGERVLSRLDADTLKKVALASNDGRYLNVSTGTIELDREYRKLVQAAEQSMSETEETMVYEDRFQVFLGIAIGLFILESLISERRWRHEAQ